MYIKKKVNLKTDGTGLFEEKNLDQKFVRRHEDFEHVLSWYCG